MIEMNEETKVIGPDYVQNPDSFCSDVSRLLKSVTTGTETIIGDLIYDLVSLLPFWAFLLFNNPHDCFKCLGKDPDRNYSKF